MTYSNSPHLPRPLPLSLPPPPPRPAVLSLGQVEWLHPAFHNEKSVYPVGYRATRTTCECCVAAQIRVQQSAHFAFSAIFSIPAEPVDSAVVCLQPRQPLVARQCRICWRCCGRRMARGRCSGKRRTLVADWQPG